MSDVVDPIWETADHRVIPLRDMPSDHLWNAYRCMVRFYYDRGGVGPRAYDFLWWAVAFGHELVRRGYRGV